MNPEEIKPYSAEGEKSRQVEAMFDSIAPSYDFMNTAMTFGLHRRWRDKAIRMLSDALADAGRFPSPTAPLKLLDVASGTGDVAFSLFRQMGPYVDICGIDLSAGMLEVARKKLTEKSPEAQAHISFRQADCLALPFDDDSFDAITVAYGVRNFEHLQRGYEQMYRVLRPGGILCVIELCEPASALMRAGYRLYARHIIPAVGRLVSKDSRAYSYLPESITACPQREQMTRLMEQAGFRHATWRTLFPSTIAIYLATK